MTTRPETVPGIARISRKKARTGRAPFIVVIITPRALQPSWSAVSRLCDPGYPGLPRAKPARPSASRSPDKRSAIRVQAEKSRDRRPESIDTRACSSSRLIGAVCFMSVMPPDSDQILQRSEMTRCAITGNGGNRFSYSITSSASASSVCGIARPRLVAVLRLMTS